MFAFDEGSSARRDDANLRNRANSAISRRTTAPPGPEASQKEATETASRHRALQTWMGYGAPAGNIDGDSRLRLSRGETSDPLLATPLVTRTFLGVPNFQGGDGDPRVESRLQNGQDTRIDRGPGASDLAERQFPVFHPDVEALHTSHVIPTWSRGGEDSRTVSKSPDFLKAMGFRREGGTWVKKRKSQV